MNKQFLPRGLVIGVLLLSMGVSGSAQIYSEQIIPTANGGQNTIVVKPIDIDNDGDQDLILGNEFQQNSISYNLGNGDFVTGNNGFTTTLNDTDDIGLADFDGDGDVDIIFINQGGFGHEYYQNDGNGNFSVAGFLPATDGGAIAVGDINDDGFPDIIIGNIDQANFCMINNGDGSFTNETTDRLPGMVKSTDHVLLEDVDADGDLDLFFANRDGSQLLINNGAGVYEDKSAQRLPQGINMDTRKACFSDVNGDGKPDLFLANVQFTADKNSQNRLYINEGNGFFVDLTTSLLPQGPNQTTNAAFHDINEDGFPDLFITNVLANPLQALLNDGTGKFTIRTDDIISPPIMTEEAWGLAIADFNSDGFSDIYVASRMGTDAFLPGDPNGMIPVSNHNILLNEVFRIYPNPVESNSPFLLDHPEDIVISDIQIYNITGQLLDQLTVEQLDVTTSELSLKKPLMSGLYLLRIRSGESSIILKVQVR